MALVQALVLEHNKAQQRQGSIRDLLPLGDPSGGTFINLVGAKLLVSLLGTILARTASYFRSTSAANI